eukprot:3315794-Alexandrium_andersonii.AAC.1
MPISPSAFLRCAALGPGCAASPDVWSIKSAASKWFMPSTMNTTSSIARSRPCTVAADDCDVDTPTACAVRHRP